MSTTGTLTVNNSSGTAVRFQRSGTNIIIFDTTNGRLGIDAGGNLDTDFEVGGTASAQNFLSQGAVQFAGNSASVAYSRFGTTTTLHNNYMSASNDLLVSGDAELRGSVSFGGVASISGIVYMNDGRFKANANSTTAFRFQNAAGTTSVLTIDTTNARVGVGTIGGVLDTVFEAGGTASATNLVTSGAVQFAGNTATVAYSRFGTSTTKRSNYITASNDLLVSGDLETVGSASFGGTASVSGIFFMTDGQFRPSANSTTAFRFQNAAGSTNVLTIDTTNTRVGVGSVGTIDTTFEVGGVASVGTNLNVGETATATTSITFETRSTTQGACFTILGNNGTTYYARIVASGDDADGDWWVSTKNCN